MYSINAILAAASPVILGSLTIHVPGFAPRTTSRSPQSSTNTNLTTSIPPSDTGSNRICITGVNYAQDDPMESRIR